VERNGNSRYTSRGTVPRSGGFVWGVGGASVRRVLDRRDLLLSPCARQAMERSLRRRRGGWARKEGQGKAIAGGGE
jgi:hypothetical protein